MKCRVETCDRKAVAKELCPLHYYRWQQHGDPERTAFDPWPRFIAAVDTLDPDKCWLWQRAAGRGGYGRFSVNGEHWYAHVWSYVQKYGPVPDGLELDHIVCDTPSCVNPDHVRPSTPRDNLMRGNFKAAINARKAHCDSGHPFDEANTYRRPDGARGCRACRKAANQRFLAKARAS